MRRFTIFAALLAISQLSAQQPTPWPTNGWTTSTPEAQGMDSARLEAAAQFIDQNSPYRYSLVVVRNGRLVFERYFHGSYPTAANHIASMTKSITSVLFGVALDEGLIHGTNQKLDEFYPQYFLSGDDPRKHDITLEHVLTMTAGFAGSSDNSGASTNWHQFLIHSPLVSTPGEVFLYNSGLSHLLSGIVTQVSGMNTLTFANSRLFGPLGMICRSWWTDPLGFYYGGFGAFFTPRDLAKFGLLTARKGNWDGRQIVSTDWLRNATRPHVPGSNYAYHFWTNILSGYPIPAATGYGGQAIFASPDLDLVVVMTTRSDQATIPQSYYDEPGLIMNRFILPSLQADPPTLNEGGVVNAADYTNTLAAGSFASVFGANMSLVTAGWDYAMPSYGLLPEGVGGVYVRIGGRTAHPSYVSPGQVNFLVPSNLAPGRYRVEIVTPQTSVSQDVQVAAFAPSLFATMRDGKRLASLQPAAPGDYVVLWASGLGPSDPPLAAGTVLDHARLLLHQPEVTVGGKRAEVTYAGLAYAGVWQVNIRIPDGLTPGLTPVELRAGDAVSQGETDIEIR